MVKNKVQLSNQNAIDTFLDEILLIDDKLNPKGSIIKINKNINKLDAST